MHAVSIRVKLLGLFSLMAAFGIAGFVMLWLYGVPMVRVEGLVSNEYKRSIASVEALADKERDTFERWFSEHRRELHILSSNESLSRSIGQIIAQPTAKGGTKVSNLQAQVIRQLSTVKEASPGVYNYLYIVEPSTGKVLAASFDKSTLVTDEHRPVLAEAAEPGMTEYVRLVHEIDGPGLLITSQISAMDADGVPNGRLLGVLVAGISLATPLQMDQSSIRQTLGTSGAVMLVDPEGEILLSSTETTNSDHLRIAKQVVSGTEGVKVLATPGGGELIGAFRHIHLGASHELSLAVTRDTDDALAAIRGSFIRMAGFMSVLLLLSISLVVFATNRIATAEAQILALNSSLEQRIEERTQELEQTNINLTDTLANLERTRSDLVRSEKLSALGSLVAGIAHELNTPIGNSLTVASTLQDQTKEFVKNQASGLTRTQLDAYTSSVTEGSEILMHSLQRAAELVSSFKQVAVDQTSVNRRNFLLGEMVSEVLLTLGPTIRKTGHQVESKIPDDIRLESYPGPLGQILTNLISNALLHGFEGREFGTITLAVMRHSKNHILFSIHDNGIGIPKENIGRVFDPFFTTKLGQGGSGLGLNIVFNLVQTTLGGSIQVESPPDQGTRFTMTLPLIAPMAQA